MKRYPSIVLVLLIVISAVVSAETLAVGVRQITPQEQTGRLLELVEQGAMEAMFQSGHIVFDLSVDPAAEFYPYLAMDQSRRGGAGVTVLLDVSFAVSGTKGTYPASVSVSVFDAESQETIHLTEVDAEGIDSFREIDSLALAEALGGKAALAAVEALTGGW